MDRQERHHEQKEKQRAEKNKAEKAYEDATQESRPPLPLWMWAVGVVLVAAVIYAWTFMW